MWYRGKQLYLGAFAEKGWAARAHDIMAIKCKSLEDASLNYGKHQYQSLYRDVVQALAFVSLEELVTVLRAVSRQDLSL